MISFDAAHHRFNFRAAAVIVHDGSVLLHRIEGDPFWSLPGGRVEPGESAAEAVVRELQEELAVQVNVERLLWVVENFFTHGHKRQHELGLYFLAKPAAGSALLSSRGPYVGHEGHVALKFSWFERSRLHEVDVRPSFLIRALGQAELSFEHVVERPGANAP